MAAKRIQLELCAPTHAPVVFETDEVVIPGSAGVFTVLPGHTPLLTTLGIGVVTAYENEAQPRVFAVHDGFAEILADRVILLADTISVITILVYGPASIGWTPRNQLTTC